MAVWEVRVDGLLLPYTTVEWEDPLSSVGSGKAVVDLGDSRWDGHHSLLDGEALWVASYDGVDRFAWVGEDYDEEMGDAGAIQVTVSGRGIAAELERAVLLPAGYPSHTSRQREITDAPMAIWRTLLTEAQDRGALGGWTTSFSDTADTDGTSWATTFDFTSGPGADLLSLLKRFAEAEGAAWRANPDRTLDAWKSPGTDRSGDVRWYAPQQTDRQSASLEVGGAAAS